MKVFFYIFIFFLTLSCNNHWNEKDKAQFVSDCAAMYGGEKICECLLGCLENEFNTYENALELIDGVALKSETNLCLKNCKD